MMISRRLRLILLAPVVFVLGLLGFGLRGGPILSPEDFAA